jgi:hypothetical protein
VVTAAICSYLLLTVPTNYPAKWDHVRQGMKREKANAILSPWDWQNQNSAYMIESKSWLRLWRIDVNFTQDEVSSVRIYHEDPHETLCKDVLYVLSYF